MHCNASQNSIILMFKVYDLLLELYSHTLRSNAVAIATVNAALRIIVKCFGCHAVMFFWYDFSL